MTTYDDDIELSTGACPLLGYTVIATLQGIEVGRGGKPGTVKPESMCSRLEQYAAVRAQVAFYRDALGMRDEEILRCLAELEASARMLLVTATAPEEDDHESTGPAAGRQAADHRVPRSITHAHPRGEP